MMKLKMVLFKKISNENPFSHDFVGFDLGETIIWRYKE